MDERQLNHKNLGGFLVLLASWRFNNHVSSFVSRPICFSRPDVVQSEWLGSENLYHTVFS